ncbi:MAG: carboxypeptidase regulatory-like domain-containing protein [Deltaproteobacteria bacterium]|nr:carboxypeptidase regulatory-like domain-containing protein [Deltaproteobacteria bacterium]
MASDAPPPSPRRDPPAPPPRDSAGWLGTLVGLVALALTPLALERIEAPTAHAAPRGDQEVASLLIMAAGRPVAGARVTDEAGQRRFAGSDGVVRVPVGQRYRIDGEGFARTLVGPVTEDRVIRLERAAPLEGYVRDTSGAPLDEATVHAWLLDAAGQVLDDVPHELVTGPDGRFRFVDVGDGPVRISASAPGHAPLTRPVDANARMGIELRLEPAATLAGTVYDARGAPAVDAEVILVGSGVWPPEIRRTDTSGRYRFIGVPPGLYELHARQGMQVAPPRSGISLGAGEHLFVPLRMERGERIEGHVRTEGGEPIEGAEVLLTGIGLSLLPRSTTTSADGHFRFDALLPGPQRLLARATHFVPAEEEALAGDRAVEIVLLRGATIRGRVLDARDRPVAGAAVQWLGQRADIEAPSLPTSPTNLGVTAGPVPPIPLSPGMGPAFANALGDTVFGDTVTDREGRFELTGLIPGAGQLHVSHPGHAPYLGPGRRVDAGAVVDDLLIVLRDGAIIEGRVVDARGFPIADVPVELRADRELVPRSTMAGEDGFFRFDGALGTVVLTARPFTLPAVRERVMAREGERLQVRLVVDDQVVTLEGRVVDDRGYGVPGAALLLESRAVETPFERIGVSSDDGTFDFAALPAPPWSLTIDHPDYAPMTLPIESLGTAPMNVTLLAGGTLTGRVRDGWLGEPLGGARVVLRGNDREDSRVTDATGTYRWERLPMGRYALEAHAIGRLSATAEVDVARALVEVPTLELAAAGAIYGVVVDALGEPAAAAKVVSGDLEVLAGDDGSFRLAPLPPGLHEVYAEHSGGGRADGQRVRVDAEGSTEIRFVLPERITTTREASAPSFTTGVPITVTRRGGSIFVESTVAGTRAARLLRAGDRIVTIDGEPVLSEGQARGMLRGPAGESAQLVVERNGQALRRAVPRQRYARP